MKEINPHARLINDVSQFQVDFVIPLVGVDIQIGIDPFLLYKSHDKELSNYHDLILQIFNFGIKLIKENKLNDARLLFDFPEVTEIGFGYTKKSKRGAGLGIYLSELIIQTLLDSPLLLDRGVRHIEEMQLVSIGIGPDRVSDISANLLKSQLIEYTQKQCVLWNLPLTKNVPISHVFDFENYIWQDGYFDLPLSPIDNTPMLFVPRRIVRTLPWINYDDFLKLEFSTYLRAKKVRTRINSPQDPKINNTDFQKTEVVSITRKEINRIDNYIDIKEKTSVKAQPSSIYLNGLSSGAQTTILKDQLHQIASGQVNAYKYQRIILEILNLLFTPELIDGELENRTLDGTERRDIIYSNDSDQTFWAFLREHHSSFLLMFETKNVESLDFSHINQVATYLGDRLGYVGFIVTRNQIEINQMKKIFSVYNDSHPRKIILVITDKDIFNMLDMKNKDENPMRLIQKKYRNFLTQVQ